MERKRLGGEGGQMDVERLGSIKNRPETTRRTDGRAQW